MSNTIKSIFDLIKKSKLSIDIFILSSHNYGFDISFTKMSRTIKHILELLDNDNITYCYSPSKKYIEIPINKCEYNPIIHNMYYESFYLSFLNDEGKARYREYNTPNYEININ